jgi:uncharacterized protein YggE
MKLRSLSLVFVLSCFSLLSWSQNQPTYAPNTISVGADGKYESLPDTAVITFGISAQEETSKTAYDHAARSADQVRDLLRKNGIDPKTAEIGRFSLDPVYDYRNPKRKLVGYRANSSVTLKLADFSKVPPIVQGLSDLDITDNQSISYVLEDIEAAKTKAAQDALQHARATANAVATSAGRGLGELIYAGVDTFEAPRPIPMRAMTMAAEAKTAPPPPPTADFSSEKITINAHVNAIFSLK